MKKIILINKKKNINSNFLLNLINKKFNLIKIGHIGTLDPLAEGLLILKKVKKNKKEKKRYIIEGILGIKTETLDIKGKIKIYIKKDFNNLDKIRNIIRLIKRKNKQKIPKISSKKFNGIRFYEYKKFNININRIKLIKIYKIKIIKLNKNIITLDIICSSGTFMREIINYIGKKINIPITILKIIRLEIGNNKILNSYDLKNILKLKKKEFRTIFDLN